MKKVVMLNSMSFLPHQGRYLRIYNEARSLVDAGYDVTLIAWDRDEKCPLTENIDGIKVERIPLRAGFVKGPVNGFKHLGFTARLLGKLAFREADLIHCFNLDTIPAGLTMARLRGKKVVLDLCEPTYYTNWPKRYRALTAVIGWVEQTLSRRFDAVLVHNLFQMRKFKGYGVRNLQHISSAPHSRMIRQEPPGHAEGRPVVLGRIGSIYPDNGIEETVELMRNLLERGYPVRLLLAGKVMDEYRPAFEELLQPIREQVDATGPFQASQIPELYGRLDFSVQLHRMTDWYRHITPTKFFESLANGVPVVVSDMGDLRELVEKYGCGVVVNEADPRSVLQGAERLLQDPRLRQEMARNGLRLVKEEYNWEVMRGRLLKTFECLLAPGSGRPARDVLSP